MNTIQLRGAIAELRWHTYSAAAVRPYAITRSPAGVVTVTGTVVYRDAFKLAQRPLLFVARMLVGVDRRQADVTWPVDGFTITDAGALTATLGTQLRGPYGALPVRRSDPRSPIVLIGR